MSKTASPASHSTRAPCAPTWSCAPVCSPSRCPSRRPRPMRPDAGHSWSGWRLLSQRPAVRTGGQRCAPCLSTAGCNLRCRVSQPPLCSCSRSLAARSAPPRRPASTKRMTCSRRSASSSPLDRETSSRAPTRAKAPRTKTMASGTRRKPPRTGSRTPTITRPAAATTAATARAKGTSPACRTACSTAFLPYRISLPRARKTARCPPRHLLRRRTNTERRPTPGWITVPSRRHARPRPARSLRSTGWVPQPLFRRRTRPPKARCACRPRV